ncbi:MAG: FAD:protein FMN transferase, partial [Ktedonobacterales bacterium]
MSQSGFLDERAESSDATRATHALVSDSRRMMGTEVSVHLSAPAERAGEAAGAVRASLDWLGEVDTHLSRFRPDSELSRLNAAAASGTAFPASELLFDAVEVALRAASASAGLFDPALLPQLEALGYDRDFAQITEGGEVSGTQAVSRVQALDVGGQWRSIRLDAARRQIQL